MKASAPLWKKQFQRWFITKILTVLILITGYTARVRHINKEVLKEIKARRSPLRTHRQWAQEQQLELYQASTYLDKRDYVAFANFLDLYKDKKLPSEPIHSVFSPLERQLNKLKSRLDGEEEEGTKRTLQELYDYYQNFYEDIKSYRIEAAGIAEYVSEHFDVYYEGAWYEAPADTIRDITSRDRLGHRKKETEEGTSSVHFRERLCFKEILDPTTGNPLEEEFVYGLEEEIENTTKTFSLNSKKQENNLIDAIKIVCRKYSKEKTGKKPFTNINLVRI